MEKLPPPIWEVAFELECPDGPVQLIEMLESLPAQEPDQFLIRLRARPLVARFARERHRLTPSTPLSEWLSPTLGQDLVKKADINGCRVDFDPVSADEAEAALGALRDQVASFTCRGCRRQLGPSNLAFEESGVHLCQPCWMMGLLDAWEGSTNRCAGQDNPCTAERPWRPGPDLVIHPDATCLHSFKDFYDTSMFVNLCRHCGHAWLEGCMK